MEISRDTAHSPDRSPFSRGLLAALWFFLFALFFSLRFDASVRTYFQIDDLVVVWLVDDAVNHGNWQPDWDRVGKKAAEEKGKDFSAAKAASRDLPHDHLYNFSAHILLSAAITKPLRALGITASTVALLHHIALAWDTLSLLLLIAAAYRLGGHPLALCSAIIYTLFPLAVQGSHYARPDAFLTAMGSALLWLALQKNTFIYRKWGHWCWLLANGVVLGLAVGGKASQLMLGVFPALASSAVLLDKTQRKPGTLARIAADGVALFALIAVVLGLMFFVGDMSAQDFWLSVQSIQRYYENPDPPDTLEHYSYGAQLLKILHYFYAALGWPLVLAIVAGVIALARKPDKLPLLLLSVPPVFFVLYFASIPAFFDRSFCPLAPAIVLLAAIGITALVNAMGSLPYKIFTIAFITALACWKPAVIQYHLQTGHLRQHHDPDRLAFQQKLRRDWSEKTGVDFWLRNIDTHDLFSQTLPQKPPKNPRIYVAEDMNDWNSRDYLKKLRDNGFIQIGEFEGDFADMPTNSLITVHQAARFVYFVRSDEVPAPKNR